MRRLIKESEDRKERIADSMQTLIHIIEVNKKSKFIESIELGNVYTYDVYNTIECNIIVKGYCEDPDLGEFSKILKEIDNDIYRVVQDYEFDQIIDYLHSEFPNLVEVETRIKKVQLGSMKLGMENPVVDRMVFTLKFKNLDANQELRKINPPIKVDIRNIFSNYFGFDVSEYGSPIELEFKAQAWVNF